MSYTCYDCKVELRDTTGDPKKCSRDRVYGPTYRAKGFLDWSCENCDKKEDKHFTARKYCYEPRCHNCITWGPTQGDGDNPWYEKNACVQCKGRLIDGRFKAADKWKANADEMKAKLAPSPSPAEVAEAKAKPEAKAESEARAKRAAEEEKARAAAAGRGKAQADEEAKSKAKEEAKKKVQDAGAAEAVSAEESEITEVWETIKADASAPFRYSKISVVGQGRAGKTAFCDALQGKKHKVDLESTVGIDNVTLQVAKTELEAGGEWRPYDSSRSELEEAAARAVCEELRGKGSAGERLEQPADSMMEWVRQQYASPPHLVAQPAQSTVTPPPPSPSTSAAAAPTPSPAERREEASAPAAPASASALHSEEVGPVKLNAALVLEHTKRGGKEPLRVLLWDFGGQEVFYTLHHLFMTRESVYVITFSMEWFSPTASAEMLAEGECFLQFWMNSAHLHTWDPKTQTGSPIFLVGTHKDQIGSRVEHENISARLFKLFGQGSHPAWRLVVPMQAKQSSGLHFFPVDNTKGQDDEVLRELMATMERTVEAEAYVKKKVPLKWVAVYEELRRDTRTAITFAELCAIARKHKLPSSADVALELEVKYMALFFSGLGFIMYHDEPSLSDLVVLDPAKFLIEPASTLICNPSLHVIKEHSTARKEQPVLYEQYASRGIVDKRLLQSFWAGRTYHQELEVLMIKFGLLVPLISSATSPTADSAVQYLVPALLPETRPATHSMEAKLTCFLACATEDRMDAWERAGVVSLSEVTHKGFYPSGLFPRLLGKAISTMQQTSNRPVESMDLSADCAEVLYGKYLFRLTNARDEGCVRLEILVESSQLVARTVLDQARAVLAECVKNLRCNIGVPEDGGRGRYDGWAGRLVLLDGEQGLWRKAERKESVWLGPHELPWLRVRELFAGFLPPHLLAGLLAFYHVFLSYRWTQGLDDALVEGLFFALCNELVHGKPLLVFWDKNRLEDGRDFQTDFAVALTNSRMIVPVVSQKALARMKALGPNSGIDNLLLEWTLAVAFLGSESKELQACFPVMFGGEQPASENGTFVTNLFGDSSGTRPQDLPEVRCAKVHAKVQELLSNSHGDSAASADLAPLTVRGTVEKITNFQGHPCWKSAVREVDATAEARFKKLLIDEATKKIVEVLEKMPPSRTCAPTTPTAAAAEVEGLQQVMEACKLSDRVGDALAWLNGKQCDSVAELCDAEMEQAFVDFLQLGEVKAKALLKKLRKWSQ